MKSDIKDLETALKKRDEFLNENPHMREFQDKIDQALNAAGTDLSDPLVISKRLQIIRDMLNGYVGIMTKQTKELEHMLKKLYTDTSN